MKRKAGAQVWTEGTGKGSVRCCRLSVTGRMSCTLNEARRAVAIVMDQPKKGLGSELLDKLVLKAAHCQILKT